MPLLLFCFNSNAAEIVCSFSPNTCLSGAAPGPGIGYTVVATAGKTLVNTELIDWTVSGGTASGDGSINVTVNWNNTPNGIGAHTIEVKIREKDDMTGAITQFSFSRNVTVLYLGPITSLSVNGTSLSNGQSSSIACGSGSVSLSANGVVTNPSSSVTYYWSYPPGWSGPSTSSTSSITATRNAGSGGNVQVTVERNDATHSQTFGVSITRPVVGFPSVSGDPIVCANETRTFNVSATNVTTYQWQPSGGVSSSGSTTGSSYTFTNSSSGIVGITVNNACNIPKSLNTNIYSSPPALYQSATVNGSPAQSVNNISANPANLNIVGNGVTSYQWSIVGGTGSIYPNFSSCLTYAYSFVRVLATGANRCGSTNLYTFYIRLASGGFRIASANPAKETVIVEFEHPDVLSKYLEEVTISTQTEANIKRVNINSSKQMGGTTLPIDVRNLKRGLYFLTLKIAGQNYTEKIYLE